MKRKLLMKVDSLLKIHIIIIIIIIITLGIRQLIVKDNSLNDAILVRTCRMMSSILARTRFICLAYTDAIWVYLF